MSTHKTLSAAGGVWVGPSVNEQRERLAEFEIHEVWPTPDYAALCKIQGAEGWQSEEEIRVYFNELDEDELQALWGETFGHAGEDEFHETYPDGWTCVVCGKAHELSHLPPTFPDVTGGATRCPSGTGCRSSQRRSS